jgi:hypothetical protein
LFHITGTPHKSDSQAVSQNVSKNVDGIKKKSDSNHVHIISFLFFRQWYVTKSGYCCDISLISSLYCPDQ